MAKKNKNIKVRDLKPKKDAKGGGGLGLAGGRTSDGGGTIAGGTGIQGGQAL